MRSGLNTRKITIAAILFLASGLGLAVRLFDLTDPPLDFHPTRQLRMAMIARGIYYKTSPGLDGEARSTAIAFARSMGTYEPPVLENLVAFSYRLTGGEHIWVARIFTSIFWLIGGIALFDLARRMTSLEGGVVSLFYYLFLPFGVIASRSFQPDPGMVMAIIIGVYGLYRWAETRSWRWAIFAGLTCGAAVLIKVVAGYMVVAAAIAVVLFTTGLKKGLKDPQVWVVAGLMALPAAMYYLFLLQGRASEYFLNWTVALIAMIFDPAFYVRWLAYLGELMGLSIVFLSLAGVLISKSLNRVLLVGLWAGYTIYGLSLPYQITTHSYYNLQLVPVIALSLAPLGALLYGQIVSQSRIWRILGGGLVVIFLAFSVWKSIDQLEGQDFRNEPAKWEQIAASLPEDGKSVALTQDYGYRLMYYGWKKVNLWPDQAEQKLADLRGKGNPEFQTEFESRTKGVKYFLVTDFEQFDRQSGLQDWLFSGYPLYAQGESYLIFDLRHPVSLGS